MADSGEDRLYTHPVTSDNAVLTVPEVADLLRVGKASVYQAIERGDLRAARFGRVLRVRQVDVWAWFEHQSMAGLSPSGASPLGMNGEYLLGFEGDRKRQIPPSTGRYIRADRIARLFRMAFYYPS